MQISMRGFQAASGLTPLEISRLIGESRQSVEYWIKPGINMMTEYHLDDDNIPVLDKVGWPEKVIWERENV